MPRLLVIEDSPTQAQHLVFVFEDAGFEAASAPDAEDGFRRLSEDRFDVVLCDVHLPGDSGFDFCRRVKSDPALRRIPVVVCTAQADPENVLRGLEAGADGFIIKQRDPEEIVSSVRRVLARPPSDPSGGSTRVVFLDREFELHVGRDQLLDILISAFEEVVRLDKRAQADAATLRALNRTLEERNRELGLLADSERRAHEERKEAQSRLVQAGTLSALGQMAAGVAHEINNPLAFIINNIAVLRRDLVDLQSLLVGYQEAEEAPADRRAELLERLHARADEVDVSYTWENLVGMLRRTEEGLGRIRRIVADLRDFARLDESDLKEVDVNAGIVATINLIGPRVRERPVALELDLAPLPAVTCAPAKINQVVFHLVANAIDACPPGGRVTVTTRPAGPGVEIQIADTGSGIDPAIRERIFDPFFTTKPQGQASGLGLSISFGIVRAHSGRIDVESSAQGSRFVVTLPREAGSVDRPTPAPIDQSA